MGGGYNTISGTSMATPHVTGAAALYRSDHSGASPAQIASALKSAGNLNWSTAGDPDGIQETLLDVDALIGTTIGDGTPPPPPPPPPPSGFTLEARGYKIKGRQRVDLTWAGATTAVDVFRNGGMVIRGTSNDGAHTDVIGIVGGGSYTYKVCATGTTTCSNTATVTF